MMLLPLLLVGCVSQPVVMTSCPPPPWPSEKVVTYVKTELRETPVADWFVSVMRHIVECDELNGG